MSDVQFEEENGGLGGFTSRKILGNRVTPKMAKLFMRLGLVKNAKQAEYLMIAISILSIVLAVGIYAYYVAGYNPFRRQMSPADYSKLPPEIQAMMRGSPTGNSQQ